MHSEYTNLVCRPLRVTVSHLPLMRVLIRVTPPQSSCPISRRQSWDLCLKACSVFQSGQLLCLACFFVFRLWKHGEVSVGFSSFMKHSSIPGLEQDQEPKIRGVMMNKYWVLEDHDWKPRTLLRILFKLNYNNYAK